MAKANKSFSLDVDIAEKVEAESNASDLVNSLLARYYEREIPRSLDEKIKKFKELEEKIIEQRIQQEHELKTEIQRKKDSLESIEKAKKEHKENVFNLMEQNQELTQQFIEAVNNDSDILTDVTSLLSWVEKYREKNIRVGITTLKDYYQMVQDG